MTSLTHLRSEDVVDDVDDCNDDDDDYDIVYI